MNELLQSATVSLRVFLGTALPEIAPDWWKTCVCRNLTESQARIVRERNVSNLDGLDLAALLRVFDTNYFDISSRRSLLRETRNWLKELQQVRNRWAHHSGQEKSSDDIFRDLDTLERFLGSIEGDESLITSVRERKRSILGGDRLSPAANPEPDAATEFKLTQMVRLRATPTDVGPVLRILPGSPQNRYEAFIRGRPQTFYADQLEVVEQIASCEIAPLDVFRARLSALYLQNPGIATLYSLHAARVDYIPYQFRPVIKFIRSDRPRLLIADEVGVGKTIEAGLILRELQARKDVRSVLVLCPKALVTDRKWERDLRRFDERFTQLDSKTLRYCVDETHLDGEWPENHAKTIIPFSVFDEKMLLGNARRKGLLNLDPPPKFDLLIVDEAHHLRNSATYLHQAVRFFAAHAEAVIFLSATPIQLGSDDLYVLLNLLRPDVVIDRETFGQMAEPNPEINRAIHAIRGGAGDWQQITLEALRSAAATPWGARVLAENPDFAATLTRLERDCLDIDHRVGLIRQVEDFHTFSRFLNRTRRRDIGNFTIRKPETVTVDFTEAQKTLHDGLLGAQAALLTAAHGNANVRFMMTTIRRRAASCLHALAPYLRDVLMGRLETIEGGEDDDMEEGDAAAGLSELKGYVEKVLQQAEALPPEDKKLASLLQIAREKQGLPNSKLLLFATFRHTLNYLHQHLLAAGVRCGLMFGSTPDLDRVDLRRRFALPKEDAECLDVLLSSEIGCEGLDYQFCDCIVNYDLPWNPMRIEQRIGRIDRYGQKSEVVAIYNLITPGTVDADIYERCLMRIGVFQRSIGGSEEILGEITAELHAVAENLSLTADERESRLQQIVDNKIRKLQEEMAMEERQWELFGIRPPSVESERNDQRAANFWVSPSALQNLVSRYLENRCGPGEFILGEKSLKTLRLNEQARKVVREDFAKLPSRKSVISREWSEWLGGANPHLGITFDAETARDNPKTVLLTPIHPLALQSSAALQPEGDVITAMAVNSETVPPGVYPFVIYQWTRRGLRQDAIFQPVCGDPRVLAQFSAIMESARPVEPDEVQVPTQERFDALEREHYQLFLNARQAHQNHEQELVRFQKASLQTSHGARVANLREMISSATNDKITTMRETELQNAEADFRCRIDDMDRASSQADILAQAVARGVIIVNGKTI